MSARISSHKGPFAEFAHNRGDMLRVARMHADAVTSLHFDLLHPDLWSAARKSCHPNQRWLVVPSSRGRCGGTAVLATIGLEPSVRWRTRRTDGSSTDRFHEGRCCPTIGGVAPRVVGRRNGSSWTHQTATDG